MGKGFRVLIAKKKDADFGIIYKKYTMKIRREWAMPNSNTFRCPPIRSFVEYYMRESKISIDPFARNTQECTYTNDLNSNTNAQYHMNALSFLKMLRDKKVRADLVVFDPPYSLNQCSVSYANVGVNEKPPSNLYTNSIRWTEEKKVLSKILCIGGVFLHFGWHTNGMGMKRDFKVEEILIVAHGGAHYDTLCMAERRTSEQLSLFTNNVSVQGHTGKLVNNENIECP